VIGSAGCMLGKGNKWWRLVIPKVFSQYFEREGGERERERLLFVELVAFYVL